MTNENGGGFERIPRERGRSRGWAIRRRQYDGQIQGPKFFDPAVYVSQRVSFREQLVREWDVEVDGFGVARERAA